MEQNLFNLVVGIAGVLGGAAMLGWLMCAAPFFVSLQTGVFR